MLYGGRDVLGVGDCVGDCEGVPEGDDVTCCDDVPDSLLVPDWLGDAVCDGVCVRVAVWLGEAVPVID